MKRMRVAACAGLAVCALIVQGSSCGTTEMPNPVPNNNNPDLCSVRCKLPSGEIQEVGQYTAEFCNDYGIFSCNAIPGAVWDGCNCP